MPRFASVILDADSTLAGLEGVDWLAARRAPEVAAESAALTARAMAGEVPMDAVYVTRLMRIRPTAAELELLARAYVAAVAPGAIDCVAALHAARVRVVIVSGGLREALVPLAALLGIDDRDVHAVQLRFHDNGDYAGLDGDQPLATQDGKARIVRWLALPAPALAVGDGATDAALRPDVAAFAAFTGFVRREPVVQAANHVLASFDELRDLVLA